MLDRPRAITLAWATACLLMSGAIVGLVLVDPGWLQTFDGSGERAARWATGNQRAHDALRIIEVGFDTVGLAIYTAVLAVALALKKHQRAARFTVGVMLTTALLSPVLKRLIDRDRPAWQDPQALIDSGALPSSHAARTTALAGVSIVLLVMLVRRASVRRTATLVLVLLTVLVCADRVLLGRHYPTDVLAGAFLGAGIVLAGLAVYSPLPRSHAETSDPLPEVGPTGHTLAVIVNPIKVEDEAQFRGIVTAKAVEAGWSEPHWHYTTVEDPGTGMALAASVAGADLVLVCGGDGTVREVCAELAGTGIPVGIIPAGTGNLLARNLDIPLFLRAAVDVALNGQDRAIDLVEVTGDGIEDTHFMVMAGMGLDAAMMEGVNEDIKKRVGWFAYVLSGLRSLMFPASRIDISIDDGEFTRHRARTVVVGNVGYLQAGMPLLPDAVIDDGLLDVVILDPKRFFSWIPLAVRVLARHRGTDDTINRMTGRTIVLRATTDTPRQLDGDSVGAGRELRMECIHGRLLVRVPR